MRTIRSLAIAAALALRVGALPIQAEDTAAVSEVLRLKNAGVPEETIVTFVRSQNRNYDLSAENVIVLAKPKLTMTVAARTVGGQAQRSKKPYPPTRVEMMRPLTRWNRMDELEALEHSPGSLFSDSPINWPGDHGRAVQRIPLVDISEDDKEHLIRAELPEVKKEDVKITLDDGGTLTITGDRTFEVNSKKDHRVERSYGSFLHRFLLPDDASPAKVSAEVKDGVLTVHLAKTEKAKPQRIEVQVALSGHGGGRDEVACPLPLSACSCSPQRTWGACRNQKPLPERI